MFRGEAFVPDADAQHLPFAKAPQESGITRIDHAERRKLRREELLAECDGKRNFLEEIPALERELSGSPFAHIESEQTSVEGRPPVLPSELFDPKKNPVSSMAEIEKKMLDEYPSELASLLVLIHQKIYQSRVLEAFGIRVPAEVHALPDRKDWTWKALKDYLERAERFLVLQLPEFFAYARMLRGEVERSGYKLSVGHTRDLEAMLQNYVGLARDAVVYEGLVKSRQSVDQTALQHLEEGRARLFQQKGYAFTTLASYLEELGAPMRREEEREAETATAEAERLAK